MAAAHSIAEAVDWPDLLPVILEDISQCVHDDDRAVFAAVCKLWRRASSAASPRLNHHSLHLVALCSGANAIDFSSRHVDVVKTAYLGSGGARPHRIIGCSHGWLVVVDEVCRASLLEPFTDGAQVHLPPVTSFDCEFVTAVSGDDGGVPEYFAVDNHAYHYHLQGLRKFEWRPPKLVSIPSMRDEFFQKAAIAPGSRRKESYAAVMVIHSGGSGLAFARSCDDHWTSLPTPALTRYADVIWHNGVFYTLTRGDGAVEAWEPDGRALKPRLVTGPVMRWEFKRLVDFYNDTFRQPAFYEGARYLATPADGTGGLLVVSTVAILDDSNAVRTRRFKVFDVDEGKCEWRARDDVGDAAVLVGISHGECVSTREYPCLKPNCVYYVLKSFAQDFEEETDGEESECSRYESGVCDLKTGVASRTSVFGRAAGGHPVWFVPSAVPRR
ncbi:hypothetical protein E2562_027408 [Oryza meyeriana var. granulata]|uniref:KIB1-4 beta-propeller domain-containing protein n=1 Tax=Oryza meyeriana var. granulata TaxID=110450 RepID=A0A6G1EQF2_9ORYZ|nr:hypothetical protein E2562_027408 [Oryza meyeriana var. granulata]